jgi:hypothetical protein
MYNTYNPQPVCWSLSLCTQRHILSHQHHPHHDNKDLHAVGQTHPSEITVAQLASVTTTTPLLTTALPTLCNPDSSVGTVTRIRDGRATGISYHILQTVSRSHSTTCQMVIGGPSSPLGKAPVEWRRTNLLSAKIKCV